MPTNTKKRAVRTTLRELLETKLKALYDVEAQLVKALPKMAQKATEPSLKKGFEKHLEQTKGQVDRLERAFEMLGTGPKKLTVDAIRGLVADAEWVIKNVHGEEALDTNLIAAARCVEHYEMASYDAAIEWAKALGQDDIAELLGETLKEEQETDEELAALAQSTVNDDAWEDKAGV